MNSGQDSNYCEVYEQQAQTINLSFGAIQMDQKWIGCLKVKIPLFQLKLNGLIVQPKSDIKHLRVFQNEYKNSGDAYVICRVPRKTKLDNKIFAIPWNKVNDLLD